MTFTIDLAGRRALVTGGGRGIGRATARALADAGGSVVVNDVVPERADAVAEEIRNGGGDAGSAAFDVTDRHAVRMAIEALGGAGKTGWDWILASFRLARHHFPHSKLLINDYSITNTPKDAARYRHIVDLLNREALLDGIGVQGHAFSTTRDTPVSVHKANLDLLAASGLPIYVTELDIDGKDDAEQLASIRRVFPVFWEHPAVAGVTLWGFRPGMWRTPHGANLLREDGTEKPALTWLRGYLDGYKRGAPK